MILTKYITRITYITHNFLKHIKTPIKHFLIIFFLYIYKKNKETFRKKSCERYQNLSEDE